MMRMMHLKWPYRRKTVEITPEIEMIMRELDEELAGEHQLLEDGLGVVSFNIGDLLRNFAQRCKKIAVVGSHRRGKVQPNDLDVLFVPKSSMQIIEFLERTADTEQDITCYDGKWVCKIKGMPMHFIESKEADWGWNMVHYTGSREFNLRVERHATRRGYKFESGSPIVRLHDGYKVQMSNPFTDWSEEKILTHLGLGEFLDPKKREVIETVMVAV